MYICPQNIVVSKQLYFGDNVYYQNKTHLLMYHCPKLSIKKKKGFGFENVYHNMLFSGLMWSHELFESTNINSYNTCPNFALRYRLLIDQVKF